MALARSSSCDDFTGDLSLFQLVTEAKHTLAEYGCASPYTAVFLLEAARTGVDVEIRASWKPQFEDAPQEAVEDPDRITLRYSRLYLRKSLTKLPAGPGVYDLVLEWRTIGGVWQRATPGRFPVSFEERTR